jgi:hypothetical protein
MILDENQIPVHIHKNLYTNIHIFGCMVLMIIIFTTHSSNDDLLSSKLRDSNDVLKPLTTRYINVYILILTHLPVSLSTILTVVVEFFCSQINGNRNKSTLYMTLHTL